MQKKGWLSTLSKLKIDAGRIWYASLDPTKGSEQAGYRPVVVLSGNMMNKYLQVVITAPLTTKIKNYQGNPILTPKESNGLQEVSELLIFHIRIQRPIKKANWRNR